MAKAVAFSPWARLGSASRMNFDKVPELPEVPVTRVRRRKRAWLGGSLLVLATVVAYWQLGRSDSAPTAAEREVAGQIARLEVQLEAAHAHLASLPESTALAARRALLERGLAQQNELRRLRATPEPTDSLQLDEWQAQLDDAVARESGQHIRELETAAGELQRQHQTAAAVEKLREALRLQQVVNASLSDRQTKSYGREAQLQQQIEELGAGPRVAEAKLALSAARAAAAGGSWADAVQHYGRAREIQQQLNREFPRSRYSDLLADGRLEAELASLGATEAHTQMQAFLTQAVAATEDPVAADKFYALAADRQQVINTEFAKSRFVSMTQLEEIAAARQALRLRPVLENLHELDRRVADHLRRRELFQAQQLLTSALSALEEAVALAPKARGLDEELRERIAYLGRRAGDVLAVQDQVYDLLLPLPMTPPAAGLRQPVPQALYATVMNANPSRNPGQALPVDSVSVAEAREFCRRLGWVLGAAVRLPTAGEMRAIRAEHATISGESAPHEWIDAEAGDATTAAVLARDGAVRNVSRTERARTTGFRVVVAVDLLAAR